MKNNKTVEENIVSLISKIGEKITIRRGKYFNNDGKNFFYVHNSQKKILAKLYQLLNSQILIQKI